MQTKRQGRPRIPKDSQRRHRVGVRFSDAELATLQAEANERHVSLSTWLRQRLFTSGTTATA